MSDYLSSIVSLSHHHFCFTYEHGLCFSLASLFVLVLVNSFWISALWRTKNGEHEPYEWGARISSVPPVQVISIEEFCVGWEEKPNEESVFVFVLFYFLGRPGTTSVDGQVSVRRLTKNALPVRLFALVP